MRFSIASMFILVLLINCILAVSVNVYTEYRRVESSIIANGGIILCDNPHDLLPTLFGPAAGSNSTVIFRPGSRIDTEVLQAVGDLGNVESLVFNQTDVGDSHMDKIASIRSIRSIYLRDTKVTHNGLNKLAAIPNLEEFDFSRNYVDDGVIEAVSKFKCLRVLKMDECSVQIDSLKRLSSLRHLREIWVMGVANNVEEAEDVESSMPGIRFVW